MQSLQLSPSTLEAWRHTAATYAKPLRDDNLASKVERLIHRDRKFIKDIWLTFNMERDQISFDYLSQRANLSAYLLGFHLPNSARMQMLCERLKERQPDFFNHLTRDNIEITDLGAGTGAASLCLADYLRQHNVKQLKLNLFDTSGPALEAAKCFFGALNFPESYELTARGLRLDRYEPRNLNKDSLHIFVMSYVWNELYRNPKAQSHLLKQLMQLTKTHRVLFFFSEPSNEPHARYMMKLRDEFVENDLRVLYPCTHQNSCPMLKEKKDWCFSEADWKRPKEVELVDHLLELDRRHLTHSGFIFTSPSLDGSILHGGQAIVGKPHHKTGRGFDYLVCGPKGLSKVLPEMSRPPYQRGDFLK